MQHTKGFWLLVGDFGLARNLRDKTTKNTMNNLGTIPYCPPEFFKKPPPKANNKLDSWSSGIVLYEMIAGHLPFYDDDDVLETRRLIKEEEMPEI